MNLPTPKQSTIQVPVMVSWKEIQKRACQFAVGKTFSKSQFTVTIKDVALWEDNGFIRVQTQTAGSYNGTINMRIKPIYQKSSNKFIVDTLDLDIKANNLFERAIVGVAKGFIQTKVAEILEQPLDVHIQKFKHKTNEEISKFKPMPNISLDGQLEDFQLLDFSYDNQAVFLDMEAKGKMAVQVL